MAVLTKEIDEWAAKKAEEDSMEVRIVCPITICTCVSNSKTSGEGVLRASLPSKVSPPRTFVALFRKSINRMGMYEPTVTVFQSKLRRIREYEAEDLELRRATASGLWNKNMHPDATMDTEEKAEIKKLTDALKGQVRSTNPPSPRLWKSRRARRVFFAYRSLRSRAVFIHELCWSLIGFNRQSRDAYIATVGSRLAVLKTCVRSRRRSPQPYRRCPLVLTRKLTYPSTPIIHAVQRPPAQERGSTP